MREVIVQKRRALHRSSRLVKKKGNFFVFMTIPSMVDGNVVWIACVRIESSYIFWRSQFPQSFYDLKDEIKWNELEWTEHVRTYYEKKKKFKLKEKEINKIFEQYFYFLNLSINLHNYDKNGNKLFSLFQIVSGFCRLVYSIFTTE
jgi:hypothetical protein